MFHWFPAFQDSPSRKLYRYCSNRSQFSETLPCVVLGSALGNRQFGSCKATSPPFCFYSRRNTDLEVSSFMARRRACCPHLKTKQNKTKTINRSAIVLANPPPRVLTQVRGFKVESPSAAAESVFSPGRSGSVA